MSSSEGNNLLCLIIISQPCKYDYFMVHSFLQGRPSKNLKIYSLQFATILSIQPLYVGHQRTVINVLAVLYFVFNDSPLTFTEQIVLVRCFEWL